MFRRQNGKTRTLTDKIEKVYGIKKSEGEFLYLEKKGTCVICKELTDRYDITIMSYICDGKCSKEFEDEFERFCENYKQRKGE